MDDDISFRSFLVIIPSLIYENADTVRINIPPRNQLSLVKKQNTPINDGGTRI